MQSASITFSVSEKDVKRVFDIRFKDSSKEIKEELADYLSDIHDDDIKITKFKKGKDFINFTYELEDVEDMDFYEKMTLEDYADDPRGASCLILGYSRGRAIHVVCGWTSANILRIITVYLPKPPKWLDDRTRRLRGDQHGS